MVRNKVFTTALSPSFLIAFAFCNGTATADNITGSSPLVEPGKQQLPESGNRAFNISVTERTAPRSARIDTPTNLDEILIAIEHTFGIELSIEPLPEQCAGAADPGLNFEPFTINVGERFGDVITRLEQASEGRWTFEEVEGIPLIHPDTSLAGRKTLLDTTVTVDIKASSMWDALCALALAVNKTNDVHSSETRPLMITFTAPAFLQNPPPEFIEKRSIAVSRHQVPAREVLCAIMAIVSKKTTVKYSYHCVATGRKPDYDYIWIDAFDNEGKVVARKMTGEEVERLSKSADWMSDKKILAIQAPMFGQAEGPQAGKESK